jgi:hypothetical protein
MVEHDHANQPCPRPNSPPLGVPAILRAKRPSSREAGRPHPVNFVNFTGAAAASATPFGGTLR